LEHVPSPSEYLEEVRRLLNHRGKLVLTTHGIYEDHGCPNDYLRWTDSGLRQAVSRAGFVLEDVWKMTTGPRAAFFLLERSFPQLANRTKLRVFLSPLEYLISRRKWVWHRWCDQYLPDHRLVVNNLEKHRLYIGVGCIARKQ
jgi:hypothetical protein